MFRKLLALLLGRGYVEETHTIINGDRVIRSHTFNGKQVSHSDEKMTDEQRKAVDECFDCARKIFQSLDKGK